jgi:two-component system, OmpR family, phosphate regulon sensor histidine kinase PhoR
MNEMGVPLLILALASLLVSAILAHRLASLGRGAGRLADALAETRATGFRRRIHLGFAGRPLIRIGTELNVLMDGFQGMLEEKQRLELSHKRLIADISHDIRTPLTSLLGYLEVMKDRDLPPRERREYLDVIDAKARFLYRMIEEFFDLARLESEDTIVELARVDLAEIVREKLASSYHDFVRASVVPEVHLPERPVLVWGNRDGIERVLDNLISNALKYGGDGGVICISMREEACRAWVDVQDHGRGIPESELPHVFDRLYTAEASRNGARRGAGLGLAIARQLLEKQNGEITASSTPGERTVFSIGLNKA